MDKILEQIEIVIVNCNNVYYSLRITYLNLRSCVMRNMLLHKMHSPFLLK